jgi:UDP-2-acetamido-2,6-beta-L-arabino-hexul-4-ose reductase
MNILVTGSDGFIGRNVMVRLRRRTEWTVAGVDARDNDVEVDRLLATADAVIHLAGVNRPQDTAEFQTGNAELTRRVCSTLERRPQPPLVLLASSIQAALDNPYGRSKLEAEQIVNGYASRTGGRGIVFRLPNVFGKWCRPNYNSVVATFCHNIARGLAVTVNDPDRVLELVYVDDVVAAFEAAIDRGPGAVAPAVGPVFSVTVGELLSKVQACAATRTTLLLPPMSGFDKRLYATFMSHLPTDAFGYSLAKREDPRGSLAEFVKTPASGQIFVSRTHPGITRGNHYHDTKVEKFLVLEGTARICFRHILDESDVLEYVVTGSDYRVLDIPPGYTHNIENIGTSELVTLFWANEIFDPQIPDTYAAQVVTAASRV